MKLDKDKNWKNVLTILKNRKFDALLFFNFDPIFLKLNFSRSGHELKEKKMKRLNLSKNEIQSVFFRHNRKRINRSFLKQLLFDSYSKKNIFFSLIIEIDILCSCRSNVVTQIQINSYQIHQQFTSISFVQKSKKAAFLYLQFRFKRILAQ